MKFQNNISDHNKRLKRAHFQTIHFFYVTEQLQVLYHLLPQAM